MFPNVCYLKEVWLFLAVKQHLELFASVFQTTSQTISRILNTCGDVSSKKSLDGPMLIRVNTYVYYRVSKDKK